MLKKEREGKRKEEGERKLKIRKKKANVAFGEGEQQIDMGRGRI